MNEHWIEQLRIFPAFTEKDAENLRQLLRQYKRNLGVIFNPTLPPEPRQGDIFRNIPFNVFLKNNRIARVRTYGIVISCTCDFEQREYILLAPANELSFYEEAYIDDSKEKRERKIDDLRNNLIAETFHVPAHTSNPELIFDLSLVNSYEVDFIKGSLISNDIDRIASLSDVGYRFFLMKLSHYFLRPENDTEISRHRFIFS